VIGKLADATAAVVGDEVGAAGATDGAGVTVGLGTGAAVGVGGPAVAEGITVGEGAVGGGSAVATGALVGLGVAVGAHALRTVTRAHQTTTRQTSGDDRGPSIAGRTPSILRPFDESGDRSIGVESTKGVSAPG
jgi:hypothetical protein